MDKLMRFEELDQQQFLEAGQILILTVARQMIKTGL